MSHAQRASGQLADAATCACALGQHWHHGRWAFLKSIAQQQTNKMSNDMGSLPDPTRKPS